MLVVFIYLPPKIQNPFLPVLFTGIRDVILKAFVLLHIFPIKSIEVQTGSERSYEILRFAEMTSFRP